MTAAFIVAPTAGACHPDPGVSVGDPVKGYYVLPNAGYGGCPHEAVVCVEVWKETNGEPGLQRWVTDHDHPVVIVCPLP